MCYNGQDGIGESMIYLIYFLIFFLTLVVTISMVVLFSRGYRIRFKDNHFQMINIRKSVKNVTMAVIDAGSNMTSFMTPNNRVIYSSLKRDFPNFDIDKMKEDIKNYIISYFNSSNLNNKDMKLTDNFKNDLPELSDIDEINMKSLIVLRVLMDKYAKEDGLARIEFNTALEYNRDYGNGTYRNIQENYLTEFVHSIAGLKKNKKIKCPKCGKDVKIVSKITKCSNCNEDITGDIWYLNNIRKI